jgi:hypothetical protein
MWKLEITKLSKDDQGIEFCEAAEEGSAAQPG